MAPGRNLEVAHRRYRWRGGAHGEIVLNCWQCCWFWDRFHEARLVDWVAKRNELGFEVASADMARVGTSVLHAESKRPLHPLTPPCAAPSVRGAPIFSGRGPGSFCRLIGVGLRRATPARLRARCSHAVQTYVAGWSIFWAEAGASFGAENGCRIMIHGGSVE